MVFKREMAAKGNGTDNLSIWILFTAWLDWDLELNAHKRGLKIERVSVSESEFLKCLSCPLHSSNHTPWHHHFCKWCRVSSGVSRLKWNPSAEFFWLDFFYRPVSCHFNENYNILVQHEHWLCLHLETRTGKLCPLCISWYTFDSFQSGSYAYIHYQM